MTHKRLAEGTDYSETTIRHTLNGTRFTGLTPTLLDRALAILKLCDASPSDLESWERFHAGLAAWTRRNCEGASPEPPRPPGSERTGAPPGLSDAVVELLARQREDGERTPYPLPEGPLADLSEVYVRQLLDPQDGEGGSEGTVEPLARPAQDVVTDEPGHLLVVAGPGGGKSTLVRRLTGRFADAWLEGDAPPPLVPRWVTAVDLARQPERIESALALALLPAGVRWLVLVDGIDEIVDVGSRRRFVSELARFAARHWDDVQLLVTTRPLPSDEGERLRRAGLTPYTLEPFDRPRLIDFAERWFADRETAADYVRQIDRARLGLLVGVPLLATITAVVYQARPNSALPSSQYLLYKEYRKHLAEIKKVQLDDQWQGFENAVRDEAPHAAAAVRELAKRHGEALLYHLAVEQTARGVENLTRIAQCWLDERLAIPAIRLGLGWPEQVSGLLSATGLLVRTAAGVRFLHTSFAEYLAAEFRAQQLPETLQFTDPAWIRVIDQACTLDEAALATLIHAAHRSTSLAEALMEKLRAGTDAQRLVAAHILADGPIFMNDTHARWFLAQLDAIDPELDPELDYLHRGWWRLAARVGYPQVSDLVAALDRQPSEGRHAALAELAGDRPEEAGAGLLRMVLAVDEPWMLRCDALRTLATLGDRRVEQAAQALRDQLLEQPRDHLDRGYAVVAFEEVWPLGELGDFFLNHLTRDDGTMNFAALSMLTALGEEHVEGARNCLLSLVNDPASTTPRIVHAIRALEELPGGRTALTGLAASETFRLQGQLRLALKEVKAGLGDTDIVYKLAGTGVLEPGYEFSDDDEVVVAAELFSALLRRLYPNARSALYTRLLNNARANPYHSADSRPAQQAALLALLVAGWELMSAYDHDTPSVRTDGMRIASAVFAQIVKAPNAGVPPRRASKLTVNETRGHLAGEAPKPIRNAEVSWEAFDPIVYSPSAQWLHAAGTTALESWCGELYSPPGQCGAWAVRLVSDVNGPWGPSLAHALIDFIGDKPLLEPPQEAVLLSLALLLCVKRNLMESAERAEYLHRLADLHCSKKHNLSRQLDVIAEFTQREL